MTGILVAAAIIAVPALAFTLWPLVRRGGAGALLPVPPDAREQLQDQKRAALRALRELDFEHDAGHVSDDDYAELRRRSEGEAASILTELDRLGVEPPPARADATAAPRSSAWLHPGALAVAAVLLLVFGIAIGVGIVRHTAPDPTAGMPQPGSRPLADLPPSSDAGGGPSGGMPPAGTTATSGTPGPGTGGSAPPPEVLQGMLDAARQALFGGQYSQALSAYQAILRRDPDNVDALSHVGLMAAMANHPDKALELLDRALAIQPDYPPALRYRGEVLYQGKGDIPGAIKSWERFLVVAPPGEDRERVRRMLAEAKGRGGAPPR